jgi:tetratricopeptide (TPR) repeat protein
MKKILETLEQQIPQKINSSITEASTRFNLASCFFENAQSVKAEDERIKNLRNAINYLDSVLNIHEIDSDSDSLLAFLGLSQRCYELALSLYESAVNVPGFDSDSLSARLHLMSQCSYNVALFLLKKANFEGSEEQRIIHFGSKEQSLKYFDHVQKYLPRSVHATFNSDSSACFSYLMSKFHYNSAYYYLGQTPIEQLTKQIEYLNVSLAKINAALEFRPEDKIYQNLKFDVLNYLGIKHFRFAEEYKKNKDVKKIVEYAQLSVEFYDQAFAFTPSFEKFDEISQRQQDAKDLLKEAQKLNVEKSQVQDASTLENIDNIEEEKQQAQEVKNDIKLSKSQRKKAKQKQKKSENEGDIKQKPEVGDVVQKSEIIEPEHKEEIVSEVPEVLILKSTENIEEEKDQTQVVKEDIQGEKIEVSALTGESDKLTQILSNKQKRKAKKNQNYKEKKQKQNSDATQSEKADDIEQQSKIIEPENKQEVTSEVPDIQIKASKLVEDSENYIKLSKTFSENAEGLGKSIEQLEKALGCLVTASELDPGNERCNAKMASVFQELGINYLILAIEKSRPVDSLNKALEYLDQAKEKYDLSDNKLDLRVVLNIIGITYYLLYKYSPHVNLPQKLEYLDAALGHWQESISLNHDTDYIENTYVDRDNLNVLAEEYTKLYEKSYPTQIADSIKFLEKALECHECAIDLAFFLEEEYDDLKHETAEVLSKLGNIYSRIESGAEPQKNLEKAVFFYEKAVNFSPQDGAHKANLGYSLISLSDYYIKLYEKLDPVERVSSIEVLEKALSHYEHATELLGLENSSNNSKHKIAAILSKIGDAYSQKALMTLSLEKFEKAAEFYAKACQFAPEKQMYKTSKSYALMNVGFIYYLLSRQSTNSEEAQKFLKVTIEQYKEAKPNINENSKEKYLVLENEQLALDDLKFHEQLFVYDAELEPVGSTESYNS